MGILDTLKIHKDIFQMNNTVELKIRYAINDNEESLRNLYIDKSLNYFKLCIDIDTAIRNENYDLVSLINHERCTLQKEIVNMLTGTTVNWFSEVTKAKQAYNESKFVDTDYHDSLLEDFQNKVKQPPKEAAL